MISPDSMKGGRGCSRNPSLSILKLLKQYTGLFSLKNYQEGSYFVNPLIFNANYG